MEYPEGERGVHNVEDLKRDVRSLQCVKAMNVPRPYQTTSHLKLRRGVLNETSTLV